MTESTAAHTRRALVIIALATVFRLSFIGFFSAGPDEGSYWDWSRHLDYGYVDHPPMVAWVMWGLRLIFGEAVWPWRVCAAALTATVGWLLFATGRRLHSPAAGLWALGAHTVSPVFSLGAGCLLVPETLLLAFVTLTLYLCARLITGGAPALLLAMGVTVGCGTLSKWPGFAVPAALVLFAVLSEQQRSWFRQPQFYALFLIAAALFTPVIVWNVQHDWPSLTFAQERTASPQGVNPLRLLWEAIVGQMAYQSPLLAVACWCAVVRAGTRGLFGKDNRTLLLFCLSAPVLGAFLLAATSRTTLPHWPASAYPAAFVALGMWWADRPVRDALRRWVQRLTLGLGALICLAGPLIMFYPLTTVLYERLRPYFNLEMDVIEPMAHSVGWDAEIYDALLRVHDAAQAEHGAAPIIVTPLHTLTGILAYHMRDVCPVISLHGWAHQYDLWYDDQDLSDRPVLFVNSSAFFVPGGAVRPEDNYHFEACDPAPTIEVRRSDVLINRLEVWTCSGYHGPVEHDTGP